MTATTAPPPPPPPPPPAQEEGLQQATSLQQQQQQQQEHCGVCHGVLMIDSSPSADTIDDLLQPSSSLESFPLPSSASAVGTIHPCGHWFHVSCFYNHNHQLHQQQLRLQQTVGSMAATAATAITTHKKKANAPTVKVEVRHDEGENGEAGSSVEIMNADDDESSSNEGKDNECPTCHQHAVVFAEISNPVIHHSNQTTTSTTNTTPNSSMKEMMGDEEFCSTVGEMEHIVKMEEEECGDDDDDDDDDIMNYYSFPNSEVYEDSDNEDENENSGAAAAAASGHPSSSIRASEEEDMFVDTTNIMAQNLMLLGVAQRNIAKESSQSKQQQQPQPLLQQSDYGSDHDTQENQSKGQSATAVATTTIPTSKVNAWLYSKQSHSTTASSSLQFFDAHAMPATPSIILTPRGDDRNNRCNEPSSSSSISKGGSHVTTKKKVRFFDELLSFSSSTTTTTTTDDLRLSSKEDNPTTTDHHPATDASYSNARQESSAGTDEGFRVIVYPSQAMNDNDNLDNDPNGSTNLSFAGATVDGDNSDDSDDILNLANALVLPSSDSKMLLWNVSTYEEDDNATYDDEEEDHEEEGAGSGKDFVVRLQEEMESLRRQLQDSEKEKEEAHRLATIARTRELDTVAEHTEEILKLKQAIQALQETESLNQQEIIATEEELATTQIQLEATIDSHHQAQHELQEELHRTHDVLEEAKYELETSQKELEEQVQTVADEKVAPSRHDYHTKLETMQQELCEAHKELEENKSLMDTCQREADDKKEEYAAKLEHANSEMEKQKQANLDSDAQFRQTVEDLKVARAVLEEAEAVKLELEHQKQANQELESQLKETKEMLTVTGAEQARSVSMGDREDMNLIREELDFTKTGMEKLLGIMKGSEEDLQVLRDELTAAKEALSASPSSGMELHRTSTSTSSMSMNSVQSLHEELTHVKKELSAKNAFIQGQLTMAKGKLIEYVRTKEGELEDTKNDLAQTKQALKDKNGAITCQLQETEQELQGLTSMKETLLTTMNELADKNCVIIKQLDEAKEQLAFLAVTRQELKGTKQALSATHLKLWSTFAVILFLLLPTGSWSFTIIDSAGGGISRRSPSYSSSAMDTLQNRIYHRNMASQIAAEKGFGSSSSSSSGSEEKNKMPKDDNLERIYSAPALYDLAMGYRNYEAEVEFLLDAHKRVSAQKSRPASIIEVASGPGRHSMEALKSDLVGKAVALDSSPEMVEYGTGVANEEIGDKMSQFTFLCEDMRTFTLEDTCDSAWILAGSLQHMTTNEDVIQCFSAIHQALSPQGSLIIELPHPNEVFNMIESTTNSWEVPLEDDNGKEYGELQVVWGDENDDFDPIKQVRQNTVVLNLKGVEDAEKQGVRGTVPLKIFTAQEMALFARCAGFEVAEMYGALNEEVDINDEDTAYRLVCILRKL